MNENHGPILNPVGAVARADAASRGKRRESGGRRVIGLIDNSKPNVAEFLSAIETELRAAGDFEIVTVRKPRSAGPTPNLQKLAGQCDFVLNAVAD